DQGTHGVLDVDAPDWDRAEWKPAAVDAGPPRNWAEGLPGGVFPDGVAYLDATRLPTILPLPPSWVAWRVRLGGLQAGAYEFRVRAVDRNGFAQPEPRPNPQSGIASVPCLTFVVS